MVNAGVPQWDTYCVTCGRAAFTTECEACMYERLKYGVPQHDSGRT